MLTCVLKHKWWEFQSTFSIGLFSFPTESIVKLQLILTATKFSKYCKSLTQSKAMSLIKPAVLGFRIKGSIGLSMLFLFPLHGQHIWAPQMACASVQQTDVVRGYRSRAARLSPPAFLRLSHLPTQYEKIIRHCFDRDKMVVQILLLISQRCMIMFHIWLCAF